MDYNLSAVGFNRHDEIGILLVYLQYMLAHKICTNFQWFVWQFLANLIDEHNVKFNVAPLVLGQSRDFLSYDCPNSYGEVTLKHRPEIGFVIKHAKSLTVCILGSINWQWQKSQQHRCEKAYLFCKRCLNIHKVHGFQIVSESSIHAASRRDMNTHDNCSFKTIHI